MTDDDLYRPNVGIMLANATGLIWVGRRLDVATETWQMPQGGIDPGEAPERAALRELKEEIGTDRAEIVAESQGWFRYDVPAAVSGKLWRGRWKGQRQKWFLMRFLGTDAEIDLETHHPEFSAWRWVEPERLPALVIAFKRRTYEDVLAEFAGPLARLRAGRGA